MNPCNVLSCHYRRIRTAFACGLPSDQLPQTIGTDEQNARRCLLIDKEVRGTITVSEAIELEDLQDQLRRYRRQATPLPLAETRRMLEELERKAAQAKP
jgi:hypothetical protein